MKRNRRCRGLVAGAAALVCWAVSVGTVDNSTVVWAADGVVSRRGMVVSVSAAASESGRDVIRRGGNAVDAAVATAFCLAVTYPPAGNIGGGGFMMILPEPGANPVCIDYRETAPAAASRTMYSLGESRLGAKVVGVPGTVKGLAMAHKKYGRLPWKEVVQDAVELARDGFAVPDSLAKSLNDILASRESRRFTEMRRVFAPPDRDRWQASDRLVQPELAQTLQRIADQGANGFYQGPVAAAIVDEMQRGGGLISLEDLEGYKAKERSPVHGTFRGFDVFGPPPPSSGGIVLVEMLNILEHFDLRESGPSSPRTCHLLIETMRRGFLDRARFLGDRDFVSVPSFLTSKRYAETLARQIKLQQAAASESLAPEIPLAGEGTSTTHFSVIDADGMCVSNTYTLEQSYGARVMVHGQGFLLNNEMGDFNWTPGRTDRKGRIGTTPNLIAPGKRMLSSQTPVLVLQNGKPRLITGSPGGRTIINTVLCVVLNVLEFEMDLATAVAAPRWHHQWLPDQARFEGIRTAKFSELLDELERMGHTVDRRSSRQGDAHSILVDPHTGTITGVADHRIEGRAAAVD